MKVLVAGAMGQLAGDLLPALTAHSVVGLSREEFDITQTESIEQALSIHQPNLVINLAAYNAVDKAEDELAAAWNANASGPRNLALACQLHHITLMHVSTDYVYGGQENHSVPLTEGDAPAPLSAYAITKLAGEHFVRSLCEKHFVVRTCGLYGRKATRVKGNFVETMLRLGRERGAVRVVADQFCTPTSTADLALALADIATTTQYGLYHATNSGSMSWYEFAVEIFRQAQLKVDVTPITTAEFPTKARRPPYSVLNCGKLAQLRGVPLPPWQQALGRYLASRPQ